MLANPRLLAFVIVAGGCGSGAVGDDGPNASVGEAATAFSNDQISYNFFVQKGLKNFQAAGIVGNLDQESGDTPTTVQSGGPGRGIAQWSTGGRWDYTGNDNAVWFATSHGQSVWSLSLQLEFLWYELTTFPGYGLAQLRATGNLAEATLAFSAHFEGCGNCQNSQRIAYAQAVLNSFGNSPSCDTSCGHYGCGCVDGQCNGGYCPGTGCSAVETTNCAAFGCGCVDHKCNGGFCAGTGCTPYETNNCGKLFGCGCKNHQCHGGFCK